VNSATIYYKNFHKCYNVLPQKWCFGWFQVFTVNNRASVNM
jgi:hypothetical protein